MVSEYDENMKIEKFWNILNFFQADRLKNGMFKEEIRKVKVNEEKWIPNKIKGGKSTNEKWKNSQRMVMECASRNSVKTLSLLESDRDPNIYYTKKEKWNHDGWFW